MALPLTILDLVPIRRGTTVAESLATSVAIAQRAEQLGYHRVWYAEHHNMSSIGSSATSVISAHIAAHTRTIRVGAGGVMLPNHAPLVIAEHFGTLAALHPGRIDLGLGRAPGSDSHTMRALRRDPSAEDRFPDDVLELQGYLSGTTRVPGVDAIPGRDTHVPLTILGSSLFGAQLAAHLGLPYAVASHFAPDSLEVAVTTYRQTFRPSSAQPHPWVMAGINVIVADTTEDAEEQFRAARRSRLRTLVGRGRPMSDEEVDALEDTLVGRRIAKMATYAAVGTPSEVRPALDRFAALAQADELVIVLQSRRPDDRLRSLELLASAMHHADPDPTA